MSRPKIANTSFPAFNDALGYFVFIELVARFGEEVARGITGYLGEVKKIPAYENAETANSEAFMLAVSIASRTIMTSYAMGLPLIESSIFLAVNAGAAVMATKKFQNLVDDAAKRAGISEDNKIYTSVTALYDQFRKIPEPLREGVKQLIATFGYNAIATNLAGNLTQPIIPAFSINTETYNSKNALASSAITGLASGVLALGASWIGPKVRKYLFARMAPEEESLPIPYMRRRGISFSHTTSSVSGEEQTIDSLLARLAVLRTEREEQNIEQEFPESPRTQTANPLFTEKEESKREESSDEFGIMTVREMRNTIEQEFPESPRTPPMENPLFVEEEFARPRPYLQEEMHLQGDTRVLTEVNRINELIGFPTSSTRTTPQITPSASENRGLERSSSSPFGSASSQRSLGSAVSGLVKQPSRETPPTTPKINRSDAARRLSPDNRSQEK